MIAFWVVAGVLSAAAAGLILHSAARAVRNAGAADPTLALYRRQLGEIDDLADRGLIPEAERKTAHAEAGRRLLAAADRGAESWAADAAGRKPVLIAALVAPFLGIALYIFTGAPGYSDQPFAQRLAAWRGSDPSSLAPAEMAAVLKQLAGERPKDPEVWRYLALAEGAAENPAGAARAVRRAIELAPQRADLWEMLAEALMVQADGRVTPEAGFALSEAVERDPKSVLARFHLARAKVDGGDKAGGIAAWRALAADLPASDARRATIQQAIAQAEGAQALAVPQGQMAAIQGMVQGLAARLAESPDDPEGWVRLVRSYAVLGDTGKRDEALAAARARFAGRKDVLDQLEAAAKAETMR